MYCPLHGSPGSVVSALVVPYSTALPGSKVTLVAKQLAAFDSDSAPPTVPRRTSVRSRINENEALILYGDEKAPSELGRWRALVDLDPEDPVFFAHYASVAMTHGDEDGIADVLREGMEREPENARYDWALAWQQAREAATSG